MSQKPGPTTMAYERVGRFVAVAHGDSAPSDAEWKEYLALLERSLPGVTGILVTTDGAAPDAGQRAGMVRLLDKVGGRFRTAVITTSRVARGVVTLLGWFNSDIRAFAPSELHAGLDHLGVPAESHEREHLRRRLLALRIQVVAAPSYALTAELASSDLEVVDALLRQKDQTLRDEVLRRSRRPAALR